MAGTGKSTLFAVAHEVWTQQGLSLHGAALSGKAARGLEEAAGIPSTTLHRLLGQLRNGDQVLNDRSVVVLDEASMIGTRQLAEVVQHCARAGAALVLCGDARQLQAIELGGLFAALTDRFETSHLTNIQRQREPWARESVKHFTLAGRKRLSSPIASAGWWEMRHEITAMDRMLADWRREALPDLKGSLMLAGTTAEVIELNRRAQEEKRHLGLLGDTPVRAGPRPKYSPATACSSPAIRPRSAWPTELWHGAIRAQDPDAGRGDGRWPCRRGAARRLSPPASGLRADHAQGAGDDGGTRLHPHRRHDGRSRADLRAGIPRARHHPLVCRP